MALVTKKYLYEAVSALLEGGDPSSGKKFEPKMLQAYIQQAINRKLKTEYLSVTLPSDETIPDGLVLACYNDILVSTYKNNLSRAILPAMPVSLRKNMGVFFVGPATGGNITPIPVSGSPIVTVSAVVGTSVNITGTALPVTGITGGSTAITSGAFTNKYVNVIRGNIPMPRIDPGDGSNFITKVYASTIITLSSPLVTGEFIQIQTTEETV